MRWLVEVSSLGNTDTHKLCVEAESWQRALRAARGERGEHGPMSGFSIELLDEGYRAVDPVARVRFVVTRAPDDMALTPLVDRASATAKVAAAAEPSQTVPNLPPTPSSSTPAGGDGAPSKGPAIAVGGPDKSAVLAPRPAPSGAPPAIGSSTAGLPAVKLLTAREQNPTEASPLTYREYAFAVPEGTTEDSAVAVLRAQLGYVKAHIATAKVGKLVNLACFDVEFTGKPPSLPVATLTWKDWKGDPIVAFPRRETAPTTPPRPPSHIPPSFQSLALGQAAVPQQGLAYQQHAQQQVFVPQALPHPSSARVPVADPVVVAPTTQAPAPRRNPSVHPMGGHVRSPSGRVVRGRTSGDELITSLFEAMHDLHFLRDALDGGQFCLALATEVLPARAALIHFFDIDKREWVVACTRGKETEILLTTRSPEGDEILRDAARKRRALVVANASNASSARYRQIGGGRSLIAAPIMQAGRALGAMEIINPLDGLPFTEDEGNAMTYIAEQFAEYLGSRGIVLDRERIRSAAAR